MTTFTLRKALRIKKQIEAQLKTSAGAPSLTIDVDDLRARTDIDGVLKAEADRFTAAVERQFRLAGVLSALRLAIDKKNVEHGVSEILSVIGAIDHHLTLLKPLAALQPVNPQVLAAKIERKFQASNSGAPQVSSYARHIDDGTSIQTSVLSESAISDFKSRVTALRRDRERLEEERLAINNTIKVEVPDEYVALLAELDIV